MVMLLWPASRASSTNASCKYQGIGSVVCAHDEVAFRIEPGGGAGDFAAGLIDGDPAAGDVAGGVGEEAEDGFGIFLDDGVDGGEKSVENGFAVVDAVGVEAKGSRFEIGRAAG